MSLPVGTPALVITVSSLRRNLQVANFQRCEHEFLQHQAPVTLHLVLRLLLLTTLRLCHCPPPPPPPVSNSSCVLTQCQLLCASWCAVLLHISRPCTLRLEMFYFYVLFFLMIYLCEKYCKPITVQYYIADCVSWVPRVTSLDLQIGLL